MLGAPQASLTFWPSGLGPTPWTRQEDSRWFLILAGECLAYYHAPDPALRLDRFVRETCLAPQDGSEEGVTVAR